MLSSLRTLAPALRPRCASTLAAATSPSTSLPSHSPSSSASPAHASPSGAPAYRVRRNTRGSIPVYTDIRNGGTRTLTLIRNVEGSAQALAQDLARSLFPVGSSAAARLKVQTVRSRHVVLSGGGNFKRDVLRWLAARGF